MARQRTVSAIQMTADDSDKEGTVRRALDLIDEAGRRGSTLVVLPELWTGIGFSGEDGHVRLAEEIPARRRVACPRRPGSGA